ncbi:MAG: winged helix-turn-helix transcriptional regulator [Prevotella sp.]|nr:winged helix-turn-helix transcriptional regulator [Prevotella sp.]
MHNKYSICNYRGGNSKARNPKIQNMLRMIGFGENVGSGFPKIIAAWKETNWGEPQLLNKLDVDEVELVLPVPSTKATSDTASANAPVNAPVKLNKTQSAIIKVLLKDNRATYEDLARTIGVDRTTIRRNAVLKEIGAIRRVGEDKNGYWEVLIAIDNVV